MSSVWREGFVEKKSIYPEVEKGRAMDGESDDDENDEEVCLKWNGSEGEWFAKWMRKLIPE